MFNSARSYEPGSKSKRMSIRFDKVRVSNVGLTVGSNVRVGLSNVAVGNVRLSGTSITAPSANVDALTANTLIASNATLRTLSVSTALTANVFSAKSIMADSEGLNSLTVNTVTASSITSTEVTANHASVPVLTMSAASAFTGNYSSLSGQPVQSVQNGGGQLLNTKIFTATAVTVSNGTVTFYPTSTGTSTGAPLFTQITTIQCSPWANTSTATSIPNIAGKYVSADLSTLVFNVTTGQTVVLGGASTVAASNGIPCMCLVLGT